MAPAKFTSALEASSCHAPGGGEQYKKLREKLVKQIIDQGYDEATMTEHPVSWADDQDPWGHIMTAGYSHYCTIANFRMFESFEEQLKDKFQDLMKLRGIGVMTRDQYSAFKRPVSYPDSLIVANRLDEVKPDRYHVTTTQWSLRQQAQVSEARGYVVFVDYSKGKPANLVEEGGVYADLYKALSEKCKIMNEKKDAWNLANPKNPRISKL